MTAGTGEFVETRESENAGQLLPKRSGATKLWLTVVVSVLVVLWWQTRSQLSAAYNLFLNGDSSAVGAEVSIDGMAKGKMSQPLNSGLGGAVFYAQLKNGHHVLEVKKPGYKTFRKEIDMKTKDYVGVDLNPEKGNEEESEGL